MFERIGKMEHAASAFTQLSPLHKIRGVGTHVKQTVDEWVALFDDPMLGNSALDRSAAPGAVGLALGKRLEYKRPPIEGPGKQTI